MSPRCLSRWLPTVALAMAGCTEAAQLPAEAGIGPRPTLGKPRSSWIPTVHVATAKGWPADGTPTAAAGHGVGAFARGLDHPRSLYVLPGGDVLVAETNAPPQPDDRKGIRGGIRGWFYRRFQKRAGAAAPSANRLTLLRDADGDGVAELRTTFADSLHSPFGMVLVGDTLYVANTDAVVRLPYARGQTRASGPPTKLVDLPAGLINHHWTKTLVASPDGTKLYVSVGSNSNAGESGIAAEEGRAAIWEVDRRTGAHRIFASGLRNAVGLAWVPETGTLWASVNERDELGSDIVPDYLTSVRDGGFYGWPYSYWGPHVDSRPKPPRPDLVARAIVPDYALGAHTSSLGLTYSSRATSLTPFGEGMFVGQHGSWNRRPLSGYKVIFIPFRNGRPAGLPEDVLTGFLSPDDEARGRPVGVALDGRGALLVADDVGNAVWRVR